MNLVGNSNNNSEVIRVDISDNQQIHEQLLCTNNTSDDVSIAEFHGEYGSPSLTFHANEREDDRNFSHGGEDSCHLVKPMNVFDETKIRHPA